jgi:hypothetical protein
MHPDRQVVRRHALENRAKLGFRERPARNIGEDLDAAGAEAGHRTIDLGERRLDIVHGERCNEGRESVGMPAAKFRERVVGEARERWRLVGRSNELERRVGEREHLLQAVELFEQGSLASTSHSVFRRGKAVSATWPGMTAPRRSRYAFGMK